MNTTEQARQIGTRQPDLMSVGELAQRSGIGRSRAYELLRNGRLGLRRIEIGERVYVSRAEYERLVGITADGPTDAEARD